MLGNKWLIASKAVNNYEMSDELADGEMMKSRGYVVSSYEMMKCQSDCEMMKSLSTKKIGKLGQNLESLILERVQILRKYTFYLL